MTKTLQAIVELLRPYQWAKNGFVLVPLFFGRNLLHPDSAAKATAAFAAFCILSSAVYIFNDWRDMAADRTHAKKKLRPLASGQLSPATALSIMAVLLFIAFFLSLLLPSKFLLCAAIYLAINIAYSLGLKHVPILEIFLVSSGFVIRLLAGGYAVAVEQSPWVIAATLSIAMLLSVGKRRSDIARDYDRQGGRKSLSGYTLNYLDMVLAALTGTTLVVYLLFCVSDYAVGRYGQIVIVTALPVAAGLLRYLQLLIVYGDGDAPTELILSDKSMMAIVALFIAIFGVLIYLG